ncbi:MAG: DEAD/DEAH box helicase, partial [Pseudomonas sagittaria]|nr:DEAD/DEAH box helicase [Pseudomonas sagittaria]
MLKALKKFLSKDAAAQVALPVTPAAADAEPRSSAPTSTAAAPAEQPRTERAEGGRAKKPRSNKPRGDKPRGDKPRDDQPREEASVAGQPAGSEQPAASQPKADKPRRERAPRKPVVDNWKPEDFVVEPAEGKTRFHDFRLAPELMHAIHDLGFPYCTPIQAQVLGYTLKGQDAIGRAQTGTGKTAAFLISTITQLLETPPPKERYMGEPRALIIAPTRELVVQIANDALALTKYTKLNVMSFVG